MASRLLRIAAPIGPVERWLMLVILLMVAVLALLTRSFFTLSNLFELLDVTAVDIIFAVGLVVVLVAGGIDISFAVAASVTQYLTALAVMRLGGGNWVLGFAFSAAIGFGLGAINATIIYQFRIISIVVTIATFNLFFGGLMFLTGGVSLYDLPDWWLDRVVILRLGHAHGAELTLPVAVMAACVLATWLLLRRSSTGRQLYAMGDNPEGARRVGIDIRAMHYVAFGWLGMMAGIAGLMQAHYAQEIVPGALRGRELNVLAAVVLGGARLGGGRGSILGAILGVLLIAITNNGLNLLGISPYAFRMIIGGIILVAITLSSDGVARLLGPLTRPSHRPTGSGVPS